MSRATVIALLLCLCVASANAGKDAQSPAQTPSVGSRAAAIVVDTIVQDSKGKPVTNLRKEDFELFEDGVRQDIGDVTVVVPGTLKRGNVAIGGSPAQSDSAMGSTGVAAAGPSFVAIVFDRLSPDARALAFKGALAYVDTLHEYDFAAVFVSDQALSTIQPYTSDRARLRMALRVAANRATSLYDRTTSRDDLHERDDRGNALPGDAHPSVPVVASAESVGRPVDNRSGTAARELMALDLATHSSWEAISRDQQGYATTNALLAVTTALGTLPGRKSVVFFAEGLSIPDAVLPHFRNVIANANRGNVSVYTIDAAGLRAHSKDAEIGREVRAMGAAGLGGWSSLNMMERNEDALRKDPRTGLTLLAQLTGGLLIESTNDLAQALRQIDADRRFHYLLVYTPRESDFNGKWRSIVVTVPTRRVKIRARSGYLAVHAPAGLPLLAYEGPALAALERSPEPRDVPLRAIALVFPDGSQSRVAVLAATAGGALHFDRDAKNQTYRTDFTIVARIVDSHGEVIRKASQPYHLSGPVLQIDQAQQGEILFFRQPALGPGSYTLEVAVHDALASRSGVRRATFVVPEVVAQSLQVSSLVLVRRTEPVPAKERQTDNPLYVGDVVIYPNLGEPIRKSREKLLTFFIVVVPGSGTPAQATVEILRDGQRLAQDPVVLPAADRSGRIGHRADVSMDALSPGQYTLRLTVTQGGWRELREAVFEVIE